MKLLTPTPTILTLCGVSHKAAQSQYYKRTGQCLKFSWNFILAIIDLRSKSPLLKPVVINAHAHNNTRVYQITKLKKKTTNYILMGKSPK